MNESLPHAVARMRAQGFNEKQIAGQIHQWHGNWTPAQVNAVLTPTGPFLEPAPKPRPAGPLLKGTRPGLLTAGGTDNFLPTMKASPRDKTLGPTALQTLLGGPAEAGSGTPRAHIGDLKRSQKELGQVYAQNHNAGQQFIEGVANSVPGVALAKAIDRNHIGVGTVANEAFNDLSSGLFPLGKAAAIFGGIRGLRKAREAATAIEDVTKAGKVAEATKVAETVTHAPKPTRARTPDEARALLDEMDKQYEDFIDQFVGSADPKGKIKKPKLSAGEKQEQLDLNQSRGKFKKQQSGKDANGNASGASGFKVQRLQKTVNEQKRLEVEAQLDEIMAKNPDHPGAQAYLRAKDLRGQLRTALNQHEEQSFLGGTAADEVAKIKADPASWDYHTGQPQLTPRAAQAIQDANKVEPVDFGKVELPPEPHVATPASEPAPAGDFFDNAPPSPPRPLTPSAKTLVGARLPAEAEQLRAVMSGRAAKAAYKQMGPYEKIGAKLDPYFSKSAHKAYKEEEKLRKQAQAARFEKADEILNDRSLTNDERIAGWKNAMRGELPQINWRGFDELSADAVKAMTDYVLNEAPNLGRDRVRIVEALQNAVNGRVPRPHERRMIANVFGEDTAKGISGLASNPYRETIIGALNVPRTLMASMDLSAVLRQGLLISVRHPVIAAKNFPQMFRYFGRPFSLRGEEAFQAMGDELKTRPNYPLYVKHNLLTGLDHGVGQAEEAFIGANMAEKFTGGKRGLVRASDRAYTGFLDKMRADVFDQLLRDAQNPSGTLLFKGLKPRSIQDEKFVHDLARVVSNLSGRGTFNSEKLEAAMPLLNVGLFSPRLIASRVMTLNPVYYARLDPFARREALAAALGTFGSITTVLALAKMSGAKVETDWRSSDFGKIRVGNTRIDIAGGFQPYFHLLGEIVTQQKKSASTGQVTSLTHPKYGQPSLFDVGVDFLRNKAAPIPSTIVDKMTGESGIGKKFSWTEEAKKSFFPLVWQDSKDLYHHPFKGMNGIEAALAGYALEMFGTGVNTYLPHVPKGGSHDPLDGIGGTGSSDPFDGVGSGSSSNSFDGVGP